jgi:hypothetical protein
MANPQRKKIIYINFGLQDVQLPFAPTGMLLGEAHKRG